MLAQANQFIDAVQGAKATFVNTFVKHEGIAKSLKTFIDAQTKFSKEAAKSANEVFEQTTAELKKFDVQKAFAFSK